MRAWRVIEADGLVKSFGFRKTNLAVDGVSFSVEKGERLGLLGAPGAGKTTLLRMLSVTLRPDEGTLRIGDLDGEKGPVAVRELLGYAPEGVDLRGWETGEAFLRFWGRVSGLSGRERTARIGRAVAFLEIGARMTEPLAELTIEVQKRFVLAQALLTDPDILVLDEPMTGLDVPERRWLGRKLEELGREGTTIVMSSALLEDVRWTSDRVAVMAEGRLTEIMKTDDLLTKIGEGKSARIFVQSDPLSSSVLQSLKGVAGVVDVQSRTTATIVYIKPGAVSVDSIREVLASLDVEVRGITEAELRLGDVFSTIHTT
jgi:ABC-2 type transport system ATP-binding protein